MTDAWNARHAASTLTLFPCLDETLHYNACRKPAGRSTSRTSKTPPNDTRRSSEEMGGICGEVSSIISWADCGGLNYRAGSCIQTNTLTTSTNIAMLLYQSHCSRWYRRRFSARMDRECCGCSATRSGGQLGFSRVQVGNTTRSMVRRFTTPLSEGWQ